jgi:hypothetical protein
MESDIWIPESRDVRTKIWRILENAFFYFSPTTGNIGEILPQIGIKWYLSIMLPMVASFLCYCLIGVIVRCNKSGKKIRGKNA